ncbi:MAG: hypothetical protein VSS75_026875 [Candidatus Parabeggiatoa sp.]|nr:hypothetical protein [Candidatus Parabeggiatoa sp.]
MPSAPLGNFYFGFQECCRFKQTLDSKTIQYLGLIPLCPFRWPATEALPLKQTTTQVHLETAITIKEKP